MNDRTADTIATEVADWRLLTAYGLPLLVSEYRDHAQLAERFPEPPQPRRRRVLLRRDRTRE